MFLNYPLLMYHYLTKYHQNCKLLILLQNQLDVLVVNHKNNREFVAVNKNIAGRSQEKYRLANIGKINEKHDCCCGEKFTNNGIFLC